MELDYSNSKMVTFFAAVGPTDCSQDSVVASGAMEVSIVVPGTMVSHQGMEIFRAVPMRIVEILKTESNPAMVGSPLATVLNIRVNSQMENESLPLSLHR